MIDQPDRMEAEFLASMRAIFELMPRLTGLRREEGELNFLAHRNLLPREIGVRKPSAFVSHGRPRRVNYFKFSTSGCGAVARTPPSVASFRTIWVAIRAVLWWRARWV